MAYYILFFFITLVCAEPNLLYRQAYSQLNRLIYKHSPDGNASYFMCKHGPPGKQGFPGPIGKFDLPDYGTQKLLREYMTRFIPDPSPECSVEETVKAVFERLKKLKQPYDVSMQEGPLGFPGPPGHDASTVIGLKLAEYCFTQQNVTTRICPFHRELERRMTSYLLDLHAQTDCPDNLFGYFGRDGVQGLDGFHAKGIEVNWDKLLAIVNCQKK